MRLSPICNSLSQKGKLAGLEDEDEEEEEEQEEVQRERMPIELEPDHKGTEIRLEGIKSMQGQIHLASSYVLDSVVTSCSGCATLQVELLQLQLACFDCRTAAKVGTTVNVLV